MKDEKDDDAMTKTVVASALFLVVALIGVDSMSALAIAADNETAAPEQKGPLVSTLDNQSQVSVTIYNSNLGLVKDVREIDLTDGERELRLMDVASEIIPTTVHVKSLTDAQGFDVLEQNYE